MGATDFMVISIEGNIGSGKSTLLSNLRDYYAKDANVVFLKEPVDEWEQITDKRGATIIQKFYADQKKYSFAFQMMAYISRLNVLRLAKKEAQNRRNKKSNEKTIFITERSLYTDKMVFAKMLYDDNKIEEVEYQIYLKWFNSFVDEFPVNQVIYVKTDPEVCFHRIKSRLREGEENVPLNYLTNCSEYHDNMLNKQSATCVCDDQLVLDGNTDIYQDGFHINEWIHMIDAFIRPTATHLEAELVL